MSGLDAIKNTDLSLGDTAQKWKDLTYPVAGEKDPLEDINAGIKKNMEELEARYAQPNWFKIAAGFAKPQLGGFTASLGSAADAAGDWQEQQKALQIPLFKMRTELAANSAILNRNKTINDKIAAWKADPKNAGLNVPADQLAEWQAQASGATGVKALTDQTTNAAKMQELAAQQNKIAIEKLGTERQILESAHNANLVDDPTYKSELKILKQRAAALNSPSDATTNQNYVPKPNVVNNASEPKAEAAQNTFDPTNTVAPKQKSIVAHENSAENVFQPEKHQYVAQALRPTGEPAEYYSALMKNRFDQATSLENETAKNMAPYYLAADPAISNNFKKAANDIDELSTDKSTAKGYAAVHNLVREGGPLAAAMQSGLIANFGNLNAGLRFDYDEYKKAGLPKEYWPIADRVLTDYVRMANAQAKLDGMEQVNKDNIGKLAEYVHLNRTPAEAAYSTKDALHDFEMREKIGREQRRLADEIRSKVRDELAPNTAAYRHSNIEKIKQQARDIRELEYQIYLKAQREHNKRKVGG